MTGAAWDAIANLLQLGVGLKQMMACELPSMAPSEDPNDYPLVCNLLSDMLATFDSFQHLSGALSAGALQCRCFYVSHAELEFVSEPREIWGGVWYGMRQ